jgi:hypothetical protein
MSHIRLNDYSCILKEIIRMVFREGGWHFRILTIPHLTYERDHAGYKQNKPDGQKFPDTQGHDIVLSCVSKRDIFYHFPVNTKVMAGFNFNPLTGLLIIIIGIAFIVAASALFLTGNIGWMFISVISSFILIIVGSIIYFAGETAES